jgi:hypothetical protein
MKIERTVEGGTASWQREVFLFRIEQLSGCALLTGLRSWLGSSCAQAAAILQERSYSHGRYQILPMRLTGNSGNKLEVHLRARAVGTCSASD